MSERFVPKRVENFTAPFLIMSGVILFMMFWVFAALWGFMLVVFSALGINFAIRYLEEKIRS